MRRASSSTISTGSGSATAAPSRPAITSRRSKARGRRCPATCRSTASRPTSSAAPSPTARAGAGGSTQTGTCVLYFTRAEIEDGALAGKGLELAWADGPGRPVLPRDPGLGPDPVARRQRHADRLCRPERPRLCRDRAAAARPRHPPAGRREHAGDQGLDPRQSRPGQGADARESVATSSSRS